jgi:hypothetical protein
MGIAYALMKRDKPEVFDLGKGSIRGGWMKVFERRLGWPFGALDDGNFLDPIVAPPVEKLAARIKKHDHGYTGDDVNSIAKTIVDWIGNDVCFLVNYWEEVQYMIEEGEPAEAFAKEFDDLSPKLAQPMNVYKQTGSVWD